MPKFKTVYIHMGADKTGSTTLQAFMDKNRQTNELYFGVYYAPEIWHARFASYFSGSKNTFIHNVHSSLNDVAEITALDSAYMESFESWISGLFEPKILVLSYEGFHCLDSSCLSLMRSYLLQFANNVKIIYYIRPPVSYGLSGMSQHIKMGMQVFDKPPIAPYKSLITNLQGAFSDDEIIIKKFSKKGLKNGDVVEDFLFTVAKATLRENHQMHHSVNESLSDIACFVGNKVIESVRNCDFIEYENNFQLGKEIEPFLSKLRGGRAKLTRKQLGYVLEESRETSIFIKDNYGINLDEDICSCVYTAEEMRVIESKIFNDAVDQICNQLIDIINDNGFERKYRHIDFETVQLEDVKGDEDIDRLRDEALRVEKTDLKKSIRLMSIAQEARPDGPLIKAKLQEYLKLLNGAPFGTH
ncbi:hypothetical protein N9383_05165 [Granulosicoccus sp.]|nr:hypothetical protein [Granulosicoccus sp.]